MSFTIIQTPRFRRDVTVRTPVAEGYDEQKLTVVFNLLDDSREEEFDTSTLEGQKNRLRAMIHELPDVSDENGKTVPHSPELVESLLRFGHIRLALMVAYNKAVLEERLGN